MKKKSFFAATTVILLLVSLLLAACNNNTTLVTPEVRWRDNESQFFTISLENSAGENNVATYDNQSFNRDFPLVQTGYDQIKPSEVSGNYQTLLNVENGNVTYTTSQEVTETFSENQRGFAQAKAFYDSLTAEQKTALSAEETNTPTGNSISLTSKFNTEVVFANNSAMKPVSSYKKITGFYVGMAHSEVNDAEITCTYADNEATVTINGVEEKVAVSANAIDAAQLPLWSRSLGKSLATGSQAQTPSVIAFDPWQKKSVTVSATIYPTYYVLLDLDHEGELDYAATAVTLLSTDTQRLFVFQSDTKDSMPTSLGSVNCYTTVRFQSGYYAYELTSYTEQQQQNLRYVESAPAE